MDGKGRWLDNVVIGCFWRNIKYEDIYLNSYENPREFAKGIASYLHRYNPRRLYETLADAMPDEAYNEKLKELA